MSRYLVALRRAQRPQNLLDQLPPTFLLPLRQHLSTVNTTTTTNDPAPPPNAYTATHPTQIPNYPIAPNEPSLAQSSPRAARHRHPQLSRSSPLPPPTNPLSSSLELLTNLAAQPPHYINAHIYARPYLLTEGDMLRLPFHMPKAPPGTVLRLNRASMLGSREFTFRGDPWIDDRFFRCKALVVNVESEPMRVIEKTKRRNRKVKKVKSKLRYTILRITELKVLPEGSEGSEQEEQID
ncbi:MAG: hypothetical protein OHK93_002625 [Ramalina farinacea]|uniref:Large ribosomal subunit protein bL21m n=1 Tax=Ramalina farinacea TaxID=258253 RepID=A0AA43TTY1_9LECA|nr:hypothetical protein [Ramalina farinacea]